MRLDGSFREAPRAGVPVSFKLMLGAIVVAVIGGSIALAALAVWVMSMLLPVVVGAGLFAYALFQFRRWRAFGGGRSVSRF